MRLTFDVRDHDAVGGLSDELSKKENPDKHIIYIMEYLAEVLQLRLMLNIR